MKKNHKIAIVFLDEIHHIYHFISIAVELSKKNEVHILTYPGNHRFLYESLENLKGEKVVVEELQTSLFRAFTDKLKNRKLPRKGFWIKKHQDYILNHFDAVIFTDYFHHYLYKARGERQNPKFIKIPHGMAGRAYGYKKDLLDFDMHVIFGDYYYRQLKKRNLLSAHSAVVGYPKLDALQNVRTKRIFINEKPTVLYNPHFTPPFSSWHFMGLQVLDFFYNSEEYNLIFAPHINLFNKVGGDDASAIPGKYFKADNIHIDVGSEKSVNMTYINDADIYLGDVSSQAFEFIINPRPCIFLNPEKIKYKNDVAYRFWKSGKVISKIEKLPAALKKAAKRFKKKHRPKQEKLTAGNFYTEEGSTASQRAASAITEYLNRNL